ncbi:MAG TPA: hypothetical protein VK717_11395 [Opitutaceae bacterium]|jgi:hypothetical protein|nr:hypothetical protein [Opitutaceae bacterium]
MRRSKKASVLLVVLITILFTAFALVAFIDKASNDLLVEARAAASNRLRVDAYSALEVTLGVLNEFLQVDGALHSPAEGWGDPLDFAGYEPTSGRTIEVTFEDESGKLSLPHADAPQLTSLFQSWGLTQSDAEQMSDALLTWMRKDHVSATTAGTTDYDRAPIPYTAPQRSLRTFDELADIDFVREKLYDEDGHPNDLWHRFAAAFSLYDFSQPNLNSAASDTLTALGQPNSSFQQQISSYLKGTGDYQQQGPGYFKSTTDATNLFGAQTLPKGVGTEILALRITVTVHDANTSFSLTTVIAPPNGAKTVASDEQVATSTSTDATTPNNPNSPTPAANSQNPTAGTTGAASAAGTPATPSPANSSQAAPVVQLNYPFTLLEIHEEIIENAAKPPSSSDTPPSA